MSQEYFNQQYCPFEQGIFESEIGRLIISDFPIDNREAMPTI